MNEQVEVRKEVVPQEPMQARAERDLIRVAAALEWWRVGVPLERFRAEGR